MVCKLHKSLYGLKQSPRAWFTKLTQALLNWNFSGSKADTSLFFFSSSRDILIVLVYVDDIIIIGSTQGLITSLIDFLNKHFTVKDLGQLHYFLGIEVHHSDMGLHLSQTKYITNLLKKTGMFDSKPSDTPMSSTVSLSLCDGVPLEDASDYRNIVGALQYCTLTRPDLSFAVNKVCQFMHSLTVSHWQTIKRILRYLRGTLYHGLSISPISSPSLVCYTDADWASCPDDHRSTSGYCIFFGGNLVSWVSSKQKVVSRSSTESEYRAVANGVAEIAWLKYLLPELLVPLDSIPCILCDNMSTISLSANPVLHARTKHVKIDYHFVRECVATQTVLVQYTRSSDQLADTLTKSLSTFRFLSLHSKLNVLHRPLSLRGDDKV
ncbi:uncharacterized mitochondrial protein AtMg00810-like [Zingiber officinale]|uniref:uncharacterized mitochondrial protein AtMg00810-like n=1 Tax=Zingiber officinale TaxID=94328 RepID=UPI001C4D6B1D|nr:uncharacterized mitochondrial protein AtMg00810-like [Zingiber officinale]